MHITQLQQARCDDRRQITRAVDPANWILSALPETWRLLSFHFFIDWNQHPSALGEEVWMTRLLRLDAGESIENIHEQQILTAFTSGGHKDTFIALQKACSHYGQTAVSIILPEIDMRMIGVDTPIWKLHIAPYDLEFTIEKLSLSMLMREIQAHSGGRVVVGTKGLTYGTSAVECYLSKTDAAYPGDVDAVIVNESGVAQCIIEFKKHTLNDRVEDHLVSRYYPQPDGRKYRRLDCLVHHYQQLNQIELPFVLFYFATRMPVIRLQVLKNMTHYAIEIERDSGDLEIRNVSDHAVSEKVLRWIGLRL